MLNVKGLPSKFIWEQDNIEWVNNYLKTKAYKRSTNVCIADLIKHYFIAPTSFSEERESLEVLISDILKTGDSGKLFIKTLSATWRAKKAREGKKHYNLSLDTSIYKKLGALAKHSSTPNASIKQVIIDLVNDAYDSRVRPRLRGKSRY
ncbi:hypothetical protein [Vibrio owensii]|uniref:hypothetical protein n=1 Tax=Vibrio owensii TaxID=696485 RepID=UPI0022DD765C|nr:hypothetical protein [Vibrio owensii]MDA0383556.1 hypothetical protein [Vibrio owensii]